jgi:hypothetical protein
MTTPSSNPPAQAGGLVVRLAPDDQRLHTQMIQSAIDRVADAGGGSVVLERGTFVAGTICLRTNINLHLEPGAVLQASTDIAHFARRDDVATAMILAESAENISITGEGTISGNAQRYRLAPRDWVEARKMSGTYIPAFDYGIVGERPLSTILLADCTNITLRQVTVTESPRWTILLVGCKGVTARNLVVRSPANASNGDGIDLDGCSDVLVEDCDIETGDDSICLKSTGTFGLWRKSRNIVIRRCRLASTCHGFCIGHETQEDFEDIHVSDCQILGHGPHPCTTGIAVGSIDGAAIRRVSFRNITMTDVVAPIHVRLTPLGRVFRGMRTRSQEHGGVLIGFGSLGEREVGSVSDIRFENITVRRATGSSIITGLPNLPLERISFRNLRVEQTMSVAKDEVLGEVPELTEEYPQERVWRFLPAHGLFVRHCRALELQDVHLLASPADPRPPLVLVDTRCVSAEDHREQPDA